MDNTFTTVYKLEIIIHTHYVIMYLGTPSRYKMIRCQSCSCVSVCRSFFLVLYRRLMLMVVVLVRSCSFVAAIDLCTIAIVADAAVVVAADAVVAVVAAVVDTKPFGLR